MIILYRILLLIIYICISTEHFTITGLITVLRIILKHSLFHYFGVKEMQNMHCWYKYLVIITKLVFIALSIKKIGRKFDQRKCKNVSNIIPFFSSSFFSLHLLIAVLFTFLEIFLD